MKKLLIATSVAVLAVWTGSASVSQAQAAPADPMCALAGGQKDLVGWAQYYGCFGSRPTLQRAAAVRSERGDPPMADFCAMAGGQKDVVGWSQFYRCWHH